MYQDGRGRVGQGEKWTALGNVAMTQVGRGKMAGDTKQQGMTVSAEAGMQGGDDSAGQQEPLS